MILCLLNSGGCKRALCVALHAYLTQSKLCDYCTDHEGKTPHTTRSLLILSLSQQFITLGRAYTWALSSYLGVVMGKYWWRVADNDKRLMFQLIQYIYSICMKTLSNRCETKSTMCTTPIACCQRSRHSPINSNFRVPRNSYIRWKYQVTC